VTAFSRHSDCIGKERWRRATRLGRKTSCRTSPEGASSRSTMLPSLHPFVHRCIELNSWTDEYRNTGSCSPVVCFAVSSILLHPVRRCCLPHRLSAKRSCHPLRDNNILVHATSSKPAINITGNFHLGANRAGTVFKGCETSKRSLEWILNQPSVPFFNKAGE
jgi:hypothetical protein